MARDYEGAIRKALPSSIVFMSVGLGVMVVGAAADSALVVLIGAALLVSAPGLLAWAGYAEWRR